jgi:hypothetical protein
MSISQIVVLSAVCAAFAIFAVVLAWGDRQTRHITHNRPAKPQSASSLQVQSLKSAAAGSKASAQAMAAETGK